MKNPHKKKQGESLPRNDTGASPIAEEMEDSYFWDEEPMRIQTQASLVRQKYSSPILSADKLAEYEKAQPGLADRIVKLAEREAEKNLPTDAALAKYEKTYPDLAGKIVKLAEREAEKYLPADTILAKYEKTYPGLADRIVNIVERGAENSLSTDATLAKYEKAYPGLTDRILKLIEDIEQDLFLEEFCWDIWESIKTPAPGLSMSDYRTVVLSLIFLRYLSDHSCSVDLDIRTSASVSKRKANAGGKPSANSSATKVKQDNSKHPKQKNVFTMPKKAHWDYIQKAAASAISTEFCEDSGKIVQVRSVAPLIDNAFAAIEGKNKSLKGLFPKISQHEIENGKLVELINAFSDRKFIKPRYKGKKINMRTIDILRYVYMFFFERFQFAEGRQGGECHTPTNIVNLVVQMLRPISGSIYDPAMGAGGFLLAADAFAETYMDGQKGNPSHQEKRMKVYGQEADPSTRRFAIMNMLIQGLNFDVGKKNADTFLDNQHPNLKADYAICHPTFHHKRRENEGLGDDSDSKAFNSAPERDPNFAWLHHTLSHLSDSGSMAVLLPSWTLNPDSINQHSELRDLVENDLVECILYLPWVIFASTSIPGCVWFLRKNKTISEFFVGLRKQSKGKILFIEAKTMGHMRTQIMRELSNGDISKISQIFHAWQDGYDYQNAVGFCYEATLEEVKSHGFDLRPKNYVNKEQIENAESALSGIEMEEAESRLYGYRIANLAALKNRAYDFGNLAPMPWNQMLKEKMTSIIDHSTDKLYKNFPSSQLYIPFNFEYTLPQNLKLDLSLNSPATMQEIWLKAIRSLSQAKQASVHKTLDQGEANSS